MVRVFADSSILASQSRLACPERQAPHFIPADEAVLVLSTCDLLDVRHSPEVQEGVPDGRGMVFALFNYVLS